MKIFLFLAFFISSAHAGTLAGSITDSEGIAVGNAEVRVLRAGEEIKSRDRLGTKLITEFKASAAGTFEVPGLPDGSYTVQVTADGYTGLQMQAVVSATTTSPIEIKLESIKASSDITVTVKAKKKKIKANTSTSSREVNQETIQSLPQGDQIKLPQLIAATNPGIVQGSFGQMFVRGNHANIQYQIDGVQLPDSPSNTFGQAFSPKNIDHMEVITGGIPAEYGNRLAAVVKIDTKSGAEQSSGNAEIGYGDYRTFTPQASYSGSNSAGDFHYFLSSGFSRTDRGLDTPTASDPIHDQSNGHDGFVKLDWQLDNSNKLTFIANHSYTFYQIPNLPSAAFNNDNQAETNTYGQLIWKHAVSATEFFQFATSYKFSKILVANDLANDLLSNASSFSENRSTHNFGFKGDYQKRLDDQNLFKSGIQLQASRSVGLINVVTQNQGSAAVASADNHPTTGYSESAYVQDEYKIFQPLTLNAGVRVDVNQYRFWDSTSQDSWVQPRIGLSYLISEQTKVHAFYGLLYQPAPVENLRDTFVNTGAGNSLSPYDIKAEKDNYWEVGVTQAWGDEVIGMNTYYKTAKNMLDDAQLLNTSIAQPYNLAQGYAYGVEFSLTGKFNEEWSHYVNYSYEIAKGRGLSGGLFTNVQVANDYQFLDHVQLHTANAGITYQKNHFTWTGQGLFGSGLRTGPGNSQSLPSHFTMDQTLSYQFSEASLLPLIKASVDVLNIFDNPYAISIANGYNGSHYAAGREVFVRLSRDF